MDKWNRIKIFVLENKIKFIIGIISILLISLLSVASVYYYNNKKNNIITYEPVIEEQKPIEEVKEYYYVDIKGLVNNPGVYSIEKGKRVVDAINQAGGVLENGNTSLLNLSMLLQDQMVIIIYSNQEINSLEETVKKAKTKETICQSNDACISSSKTTIVPNLEQNNSSNVDISSEKININTASKEILMTLSKIGESKANSIIEYREKNGDFKTIEEIKNVSGIGDSLFESIKDFITV